MRRLTVARVLVVIGALLAVLAVVAVWVSRQALETEEWTRTSSALLEEPAVQSAVAGFLVDELYANVDVEDELRAALPDRADALAGPVAGALRGSAERVAREALDRPRVQAAWENANRRAHELLVDVVLENRRDLLATDRDVVTLDLKTLLGELAARVGARREVVDKLSAEAATIEVLRSDQLGMVQSIARAIKPLTLALLFGVFACFGGAVALARGHRREIVRDVGVGLVLAGGAALVVRRLAGGVVVDALASTAAVQPAIRDAWRVGTSLLLDTAMAVLAYGALAIAGAWLAGPARVAVRLRSELAPYLRDARVTYGVVAAVVLLVLFWGPTEATQRFVPALVLTALLLAGVEALRRQVRAEFPDAARRRGAQHFRELLDRARGLLRSDRPLQGGERPHAPARDGAVAQLERLDQLHRVGGLDDEEFQQAKHRVLTTL